VTIQELVAGAQKRFVQAGISTTLATLDAEVLARRVLGWDRARFLTDRHEAANSAFLLNYEDLVSRRERREPISYIVGTREFWSLDFEVTPDVLIPRPETELVVQEALERIEKGSQPLIMDIGTGSGCLAVVLAVEVPAARVVATDVSPRALDVARRNAARHGVGDRIRFVETSFLDGVVDKADVIVSNPPYVPSVWAPGLTPEVRDYEPGMALFAGEDGLDGLRQVLQSAERALVPGGWLMMEFGYGQDERVSALIQSVPSLSVVKVREDLQQIPRVAVVRKT
jgi:release factor glutamine methyltransferase